MIHVDQTLKSTPWKSFFFLQWKSVKYIDLILIGGSWAFEEKPFETDHLKVWTVTLKRSCKIQSWSCFCNSRLSPQTKTSSSPQLKIKHNVMTCSFSANFYITCFNVFYPWNPFIFWGSALGRCYSYSRNMFQSVTHLAMSAKSPSWMVAPPCDHWLAVHLSGKRAATSRTRGLTSAVPWVATSGCL